MENIVDVLKSIPDYIGGNGKINEEIEKAEQILKTQFASDYRQYLSKIGLACFDGTEITGLTEDKRLSVVDVTMCEREANPDVPTSWYVVEQTNIDNIVIWQAPSGEIYQTISGSKGYKICENLTEYIIGNCNK